MKSARGAGTQRLNSVRVLEATMPTPAWQPGPAHLNCGDWGRIEACPTLECPGQKLNQGAV
jgi:hypothetical protein